MSAPRNQPIQVLMLDHHTLVRDGLCLLLEDFPKIEVVGQAGSSEEGLELVKKFNPDIILLELNLDCELDTEVIPELLEVSNHAKILLVTGIDETQIHNLAIQMGAMGVVHKSQNKRVLIKAIEKVHAGEVWIDRTMMANILTRMTRARLKIQNDPEVEKISLLSVREREVVTLIGEGLKNKEIARRLTISETTVRHHLTSIYSKLQVSDRLELTIYAYQNGLAELPS